MDEIERAEGLESQAKDFTIKAIRQAAATDRPSARFCTICEEEIPQKRRDYIPGVQLCVRCQRNLEEHP